MLRLEKKLKDYLSFMYIQQAEFYKSQTQKKLLGKWIIFISALFFGSILSFFHPLTSFAAFDNTSGFENSCSATSLSYSFVVSGTSTGVFTEAKTNSGLDDFTSATDNGSSMTEVGHVNDSGGGDNDGLALFWIPSPSTGSNNIIIHVTNSTCIDSFSDSYTATGLTLSTSSINALPTVNLLGASTTILSGQFVFGIGWSQLQNLNTATTYPNGIALRNNYNANSEGGGEWYATSSADTFGFLGSSMGDPGLYVGAVLNAVGPPPSSSSTISFVFPVNNTSTGQFNNYQLSLSNLSTSSNYLVRVGSTICTSFGNCAVPFFANNGNQSGQQILSSGVQVPFSPNTDYQNNVSVNSFATLFDSSGNVLATSSISWTLLSIPSSSPSSTLSQGGIFINTSSTGNGTFTISTTTGNQAIVVPFLSTSTASAATWCPSPTGFNVVADVGYGLCQAINFAFNPNVLPISGSLLSDSELSFEQAPPFSFVFLGFNQISSQVQNSSTQDPEELMVPLNLGSASGTIDVLGSSTLSQAVTPSGKTVLFSLEDLVFDALTFALIFFVPWHWWRKKQISVPVK